MLEKNWEKRIEFKEENERKIEEWMLIVKHLMLWMILWLNMILWRGIYNKKKLAVVYKLQRLLYTWVMDDGRSRMSLGFSVLYLHTYTVTNVLVTILLSY